MNLNEAAPMPADLDVRSVAIYWTDATADGCRPPRLVVTGCSDYEAAGLLRGALKKLERDNADGIWYEDEDEDDSDDDDDE